MLMTMRISIRCAHFIKRLLPLSVLLLAVFPAGNASAGKLIIKIGTMAPEGSAWHDALLQIRQDWSGISGGDVELRIYPGGVLGGEAEMVRKVQRGALDGIAISGAGLSYLHRDFNALAVPLMLQSYEELDHVRSKMSPLLKRRLAERKMIVLGWAEAGWVFFFSKRPVRTPDDLRSVRLWTSAGSPEVERLFKQFDVHAVPLPATEMATALQTGLIDAIQVPAIFAMLDGSYESARFMTSLKWAPLNAALAMSTRKWNTVPEAFREPMAESAKRASEVLREALRKAGTSAVTEMQKRGLNVVKLDAAEHAKWDAEIRAAYPHLRGEWVDEELFDDVVRYRDEFRNGVSGTR